MNEYIEPM